LNERIYSEVYTLMLEKAYYRSCPMMLRSCASRQNIT